MRKLILIAATLLLAATPSVARAGDDSILLVDATAVSPLFEDGTVSDSFGYGAEMIIMSRGDPFSVVIGGFFAVGAPDDDKTMRDIYDFHVDFAMHPEVRDAKGVIPFLAIGLDVLNVTTRLPGGVSHRGTTLGVNARAGISGYITKRVFYSVSASYLGAVVPGTGDDMGGLVLQAGLGWKL